MNKKQILPSAFLLFAIFMTGCSSEITSDAKLMADLNCNLQKVDQSLDSLREVRTDLVQEFTAKMSEAIKDNNVKALQDVTTEMKEKRDELDKVDEEISQKREIADDKARVQKRAFRTKYRGRDEDEIKYKEQLLEFSKNCK